MDSLRRLAQLQAGEPSSDWTDADAEPGTFEYETHRFRLDLEAYRGRSDLTGQRRRFVPAADLLGRELPKTPWLVNGVIPDGSVCVLGGEPKTLKTWAGMDLALSIAAGSRAFGEFSSASTGRTVALRLLEDSERSARSRLSSLARGHGLDPTEALRNIHVLCRGSLDLGNDRDLCVLGAELRMLPGGPPALVMLDPFRDAHRGEEDQSGPMAEIMGRLRAVRDLVGCSVLVTHHTGKANRENSNRRPGQRLRGSSAIHGAIDGGLYLTLKDASPTNFLNAVEIETKAAAGAGRFNLRLQIEDDTQGEAVRAAWKVERGDEVFSADDVEHVVAILQHHDLHNPGAPLSRKQIASRMHRREDAVGAALRLAESQGRVRQAFRGHKSVGYTLAAERHLKAVPPPTNEGEK